MADEEKKKKGTLLGTVGRAIGRGAKRTAGAAKKAVLTDPRVERVREVFTTEAPDTPKRTTTPTLTKEKIEAARKPISTRRKVARGALRGVGGALRTRGTGREMVGDVIPKIAGTAGTPLARASERTVTELSQPVRPLRRKTRPATRRTTRYGGR